MDRAEWGRMVRLISVLVESREKSGFGDIESALGREGARALGQLVELADCYGPGMLKGAPPQFSVDSPRVVTTYPGGPVGIAVTPESCMFVTCHDENGETL